jgi:hypothetical protein
MSGIYIFNIKRGFLIKRLGETLALGIYTYGSTNEVKWLYKRE